MTNFGIIKSKIEDVLLESYKNDTFKEETDYEGLID